MTAEATGVQKTWDCEETGDEVIILSFLRKRIREYGEVPGRRL